MAARKHPKKNPTVGESVDAVVDPAKVTLENVARLVKNHNDILRHNVNAGLIHLPPVAIPADPTTAVASK